MTGSADRGSVRTSTSAAQGRSGATFTDWREVPDWSCPSWPIAECGEDGSAVITIPDGTGGMCTVGTVAEQLFYEVGDPYRYVLPDVVVDMTGMQLEQVGATGCG